MKKIFLIISLFLIISIGSGCESQNQIENYTKTQYNSIFESGNYIIVDVRSKNEYDVNHVVDAINIPLDEINEDINLDKSKNIFVYCLSGNRSKKASELLNSYGYTVYDLGAFETITLDKIR